VNYGVDDWDSVPGREGMFFLFTTASSMALRTIYSSSVDTGSFTPGEKGKVIPVL
jgi:hypothetical protein